MSKIKDLEDRVKTLEAFSQEVYTAIKQLEEKTGIKLETTKGLLSIPPYDPSLQQEFSRKL
ncbi:hypothetical protein ES703_06872 [subsurface metagenome]